MTHFHLTLSAEELHQLLTTLCIDQPGDVK